MIQPILQEKLLFPEILWSLPQNVHKRSRGKVFVVAGNLASGIPTVEAAQKTGAGVVTLGLPEGVAAAGRKFLPEDLAVTLPESREGTLSLKAADQIFEHANSADVTVVGGATTRNPETLQLLGKVVPGIQSALIVFGDAIFALNLSYISKRKAPTVVIVDAGELGRLFVASGYTKHEPRTIVEHIYQHRFEVVAEAAATYHTVIVLHGPDTAIASPYGKVVLEKTALEKPEIAAGIIAGVLAQNKAKPFEATAVAVHIFRKAREKSSHISTELPAVLTKLEKET